MRPGKRARAAATSAATSGVWAPPPAYDHDHAADLEDHADHRLYAAAQALFQRRLAAAFVT